MRLFQFFENQNIRATPVVSELTKNCKLHPADPNFRFQEGTDGKSLNLGKSYQLLCFGSGTKSIEARGLIFWNHLCPKGLLV